MVDKYNYSLAFCLLFSMLKDLGVEWTGALGGFWVLGGWEASRSSIPVTIPSHHGVV